MALDRVSAQVSNPRPPMWHVGDYRISFRVCNSYIFKYLNIKIVSDVFRMQRINQNGVVEALHIHFQRASIDAPPPYHAVVPPPPYETVVALPRYDGLTGVVPPPSYSTAIRERDARITTGLILHQCTDSADV